MDILLKIFSWVPVLIGLLWIYVVVAKKRKIQKGEMFWAILFEIVVVTFASLVTFVFS